MCSHTSSHVNGQIIAVLAILALIPRTCPHVQVAKDLQEVAKGVQQKVGERMPTGLLTIYAVVCASVSFDAPVFSLFFCKAVNYREGACTPCEALGGLYVTVLLVCFFTGRQHICACTCRCILFEV